MAEEVISYATFVTRMENGEYDVLANQGFSGSTDVVVVVRKVTDGVKSVWRVQA